MSNDIKAGDLVAVLNRSKCCGCVHRQHGAYFLVESVYFLGERVKCSHCGYVEENPIVCDDGEFNYNIEFCRKIPPLSDLEDVSTQRQDLLPNEQKETV